MIPGWGTKIPQATHTQCDQKKKKNHPYEYAARTFLNLASPDLHTIDEKPGNSSSGGVGGVRVQPSPCPISLCQLLSLSCPLSSSPVISALTPRREARRSTNTVWVAGVSTENTGGA